QRAEEQRARDIAEAVGAASRALDRSPLDEVERLIAGAEGQFGAEPFAAVRATLAAKRKAEAARAAEDAARRERERLAREAEAREQEAARLAREAEAARKKREEEEALLARQAE